MRKQAEVDLNLRHYIGNRSDVIKDVKTKISNYLRSPEISIIDRSIYSAIYNSLTYYQNISDLSISGESEDKTFLENTLKDFNEDIKYLCEKYNSDSPFAPKVIEVKGRIKSPISAMDKILEKVTEYVKDGRDLTKLNESLRDFIGLRIIINPPPEVVAQGKQAESDFCYMIFDDLMKHKGIQRQLDGEPPESKDFEFISVNTAHHPNKLQKIMDRPKKEGYAFNPEQEGVFIPQTRPESCNRYAEFFKDYRMYPKKRLYQRIHTCAKPFYSKFIPKERLPNFIIPAQITEPAIEYQMCLKSEEEFAEHGKAAHSEYKEKIFHRLAIPLLMFDDEESNKVRTGRLDESMEEFYGYSFQDMFGIDYQTFLRTFDRQQQDEILAQRLQINLDKDTNEYVLTPSPKIIIADKEQSTQFLQNLIKTATTEELKRFCDVNGILDGSIYTQFSTTHTPHSTQQKLPKKIKLYKLEAHSQEKSVPRKKSRISKRKSFVENLSNSKLQENTSSSSTQIFPDEPDF